MKLCYGLDLKTPYRLAKKLHADTFELYQADNLAGFSQFSAVRFPINVVIALPDADVFNKITSEKKLDALLKDFQCESHLHLYAVDIESEALARALIYLCPIKEDFFGVLNIDREKTWLSVFNFSQKIFFHLEKTDNLKNTVKRFFRLFNLNFPDLKIRLKHCYVIGENADKKWGKIPVFKIPLEREFLLSCGLSLWKKKTCANLLTKAVQQKHRYKKSFFKSAFKTIFIAFLILLLLHAVLLLLLRLQNNQIYRLEKKSPQLISQLESLQQIKNLQKAVKAKTLPVKFLTLLNVMMPMGIFLDSLAFESEKIMMAGQAETETQVKTFIARLKNSGMVLNVALKNFKPLKTQAHYSLASINFIMEMQIKPAIDRNLHEK